MEKDELVRMLEEDEFGLLELPVQAPVTTPEGRVVAAYEEIADFVRTNGRPPKRDSTDIGEMKLAMRLEALSADDDKRALLEPVDELGLLAAPAPPASIEEALADDPFGLLDGGHDDLFELRNVPKKQTMPEKVARRHPAPDFEDFRQLFVNCHADLRAGRRKLLPFKNPLDIRPGHFFVQAGVLLYVSEVGGLRYDIVRKANAPTRCIFENGTESRLLLQSLASNLYKDGKRVTVPDEETLAEMGLEPDAPMASVYVLRSLSEDPQVTALPALHKIGSTSSTAERRTAHAGAETTFLGAPVEIIEEYLVPANAERKYEHLLHTLFAPARVDAWFERAGRTVAEAQEWFVVPFSVIDEAMSLLENGAIVNYEYDPESAGLRLRR